MDNKDIIKSVIMNLESLDFSNKKEITLKQLASAMDLIDVIAMKLYGVTDVKEGACEHPEKDRKYMNVMGSKSNRFQCQACNMVIEEKKEE